VEILSLQVMVSLSLVTGSILLYALTCRAKSFEHSDRLALAPLEEDPGAPNMEDHDGDRQR
jgi:hypothetical protein